MAGVNVNRSIFGFPLFPSEPLESVTTQENVVQASGPEAYHSALIIAEASGFVPEASVFSGGANEEAKEETCAIAGSHRQEESRSSDSTSGGIGGSQQKNSAELATGQRGRVHSLVVQFFLNWHREAQPLDPERRHSFSFPRSPRAHRAQPCVQQPLAHVAAPISLTLDEIHAKLICDLAGTRFGAVWDISGKLLVLFQDPITKSSLAIPLDNNFCVQAVRSHLRISREKFGIWEDL
jgi:hypothetical protein